MKSNAKKIIALVLAVLTLMTAFTAVASAATKSSTETIKYGASSYVTIGKTPLSKSLLFKSPAVSLKNTSKVSLRVNFECTSSKKHSPISCYIGVGSTKTVRLPANSSWKLTCVSESRMTSSQMKTSYVTVTYPVYVW